MFCFQTVTYRGILRAGCNDVLKEGIPFDVQNVALVSTYFGVVRFNAAGLKENLVYEQRFLFTCQQKQVFHCYSYNPVSQNKK